MSLGIWALFVPAAFALNMFPGPNNVLVMTHAARFGFATGVLAALGRFPPFAFFVLTAAVGLGAVLATSAELFAALKIVGAVYLIWLGVRMMRSGVAARAETEAGARIGTLAAREFWTAATNPKAMLVFTAFFAPFVDPARPAFGQILALGGVALGLEFVAVVLYATAGTHVGRFTRSPRGLLVVERLSGAALVAAGVGLLFARRPASP
ncbi:LysE family translocator [Pinisolibacter aquiterrae]|uniref:LysE family translocator n=1 Tax=Pinisolibacter aquiterrae TaxID=2815579 RepID=UPI001C3C7020|nr:LysE family translocator [Pinisolibacter aquiterrae]MBV5264642.1 LysE family translocator [Pinisolibacter aquiterrae]MCC8233411.1 LysE family translocator [Pinisolibacter aquiterrae]